MEIQHLRHIVAASKSGSFVKAAKECFTSRQNIAHSVKVIENQLGVNLIRRQGNVMVLTPEGVEFVHAAADVLERIDSIGLMFSDRQAIEKTLNVAVSHNLFAGIPPEVDSFLYSYADKLNVSERGCEQCYDLVVSESADFAIVMSMERTFPECNARKLGSSLSYVAVDSEMRFSKNDGFSISDIEHKRLLLMSKPPFQYLPLFKLMDAAGIYDAKVDVIASTSSMVYMIRKHKNAMAFVSQKFALNPPPGIKVYPLLYDKLNWYFYALFQSGSPKTTYISEMISGIRDIFDSEKGNY